MTPRMTPQRWFPWCKQQRGNGFCGFNDTAEMVSGVMKNDGQNSRDTVPLKIANFINSLYY
jgi:hypothetical protein